MSVIRIHKNRHIVGRAQADCRCCAARQGLVTHPELDVTRQVCPESGRVHLDRGDGIFELDGGKLEMGSRASEPTAESDLLSDRPRKTGPKVRIDLERSTFAENLTCPDLPGGGS